jgi:thymidylate kinase
MKRGKLVCLIGIDGSGKTTLSKHLVSFLNNNGKKTIYVYGRYQPFLLRPIMKLGKRIFYRNADMYAAYSEYSHKKISTIRKHKFLSMLYQSLVDLEYKTQLIFKVEIPLFLGYFIVSDRYIFDTIVSDLSIDFDYSSDQIKSTLDHYFNSFPKPDCLVVIDVPEYIAYERKDDTPSIQYLQERRHKYLQIGREFDAHILDGSKSLTQTKNDIELLIGRTLV